MHAVRVIRRIAPALPAEPEFAARLLRDWSREAESSLDGRGVWRLLSGYRFVDEKP
jgi:hypothetical protein